MRRCRSNRLALHSRAISWEAPGIRNHRSVSLTVRRFSYPWHLAALSRSLKPLSRVPSIGGLAPEMIARSAFRSVGEELPERQERDRLLGADFERAMDLLTRADFAPLGQIHWRAALVSAAQTRIALTRYVDAHKPRAHLQSPIFVVGLPRTGTSLVQRLIAQDPERRGLMTYELLSPVPPDAPSWRHDLKRRGYGMLSSIVYRAFTPELSKIHYTSSTSLEECWMLFMPSYAVLNADYVLPTPAFGDWLLQRDMQGPYERYRQQLEILQVATPEKKLVLKSPEHLWFLPQLLRTFPDARIIWTHRDPAKAVPSYSAQISLLARQHRGAVDPHAIGQRVLSRFEQGTELARAACQAHPEAQIAHLDYRQLVEDPISALDSCYEKLGLEISPEHHVAMERFMNTPHPDRFKNVYRADVFGLDDDEIRSRFASYTEHFDVSAEKSSSTTQRPVSRKFSNPEPKEAATPAR